jgi:cysteine desulfurase
MKIKPGALLHGGGHEHGFRSGTLNVSGIVGLGKASKLRLQFLEKKDPGIEQLRDQFEKIMIDAVEECTINGHPEMRLPAVSNLQVKHVDSQAVISKFRSRLAISTGSACSSAHPEPSHVLRAMGLSESAAKSSFRISLGTPTTQDELIKASQLMIRAIEEERAQSPVWQMFKQGIDVSD